MVEDFDTWYADTRVSLASALAAWCGDAGIAADAVDEAFVRAVERWEHVRMLDSPSGWVWRTAANVVRRRMQRRQLEERLLRRSAASEEPLAEPAGGDIDLRRALLALSQRQRTAIVLFYVADLPANEVADVLEVAAGTVHATLHQARRTLSELLAEGPDPYAATADEIDGAVP